jgi:GTP cyclohydrolase II
MHVPPRVIRPQRARPQVTLTPSPQRVGEPAADPSRIACLAKATLPTRHGDFEIHVFQDEHVALVYGNVGGREDALVRVHSECMTGEVFGSLKCDCKEQLDTAMAAVAHAGAGAVLYLRQEGRGIGLANKIRAYALQSRGHDTVDANRLLGLPDDARRYDVARDMLEHLGVVSVRLMTNNLAKVRALGALGVPVTGRVPLIVPANQHSAHYLEAKRLRMDHDLPALLLAAAGDAE